MMILISIMEGKLIGLQWDRTLMGWECIGSKLRGVSI